MMQTYNGLNVPTTISPKFIISAFENEICFDKVEKYTNIMREEMLSNNFPPIKGFPCIIDEDDLEGWFIDGSNIAETYLGKLCWMVTDGHHRSIAAASAKLPYINVELDYSTITDEKDFKNF
jgi:hypothetical protein